MKIQGQNEEMLQAACQQFLGKSIAQVQKVAHETLEGHQRSIMGNMTVEVAERFHHHQYLSWNSCRLTDNSCPVIISYNSSSLNPKSYITEIL